MVYSDCFIDLLFHILRIPWVQYKLGYEVDIISMGVKIDDLISKCAPALR